MLELLINWVSHLGRWGYLAIFLGVTLESAAFLGFIVPGEMLVLFGGFMAAQGTLDLGDLMILVCAGAVLGDSIGYEVGRRVGRERLLQVGRWVRMRPEHLERVEALFRRHGGKAVFLGRITALLRALTPFVAGSSRMGYWRFFAYNAAGGIVWGVSVVLVGYFAGASWQLVGRWIGTAATLIVGTAALLLALACLWHWLTRHGIDLKQRWARLRERSHMIPLAIGLATALACVGLMVALYFVLGS
jgi:membrane protein DedA with SNARE-associated domain